MYTFLVNNAILNLVFPIIIPSTDMHISIQYLEERMAKIEDNQETILDSLRRIESSLSPSYRHCERTRPFVLAASDRRAQFTSTNLSNAPAFTSQQFSRNKTFTDSPYTHGSPRIPTATANSTLDDCEPLPMNHLYANKPLPSSAIDRTELCSVESVLEAKRTSDKPGTLSQKLAKEAIFGPSVMGKCTPSGTKDLPALPKAEMQALKRIVYRSFPKFWHSPEAFEAEWKAKCWAAIEQACGRTRRRGLHNS